MLSNKENSNAIEMRDPLTNIGTRDGFEKGLSAAVAHAADTSGSVNLLLIDLDHFKSINDAFGHIRGDDVLVEFSSRMKGCIRESDEFYRYGGDEFIILFHDIHKGEAVRIARNLLETISGAPFGFDPPLFLTASIGVSAYPDDSDHPETLFKLADQRLYDAKRKGRFRVSSKDPENAQSLPFDSVSRLLERDEARHGIRYFLDRLQNEPGGVLGISGPQGSGRTQILADARRHAEMLGYCVLNAADDLTPVTDQSILCIDDVDRLSSGKFQELMGLFLRSDEQIKGMIYTTAPNFRPELPRGYSHKSEIELNPLSVEGLSIWLRTLMQWEPDPAFVNWLHRQTSGLPGKVRKGLQFLIDWEVLEQSDPGWLLADKYQEIHLQKKLDSSSDVAAHNLPIVPSRFIGRESELNRVAQLLDTNRMVTILGTGGIGKTRIAMQVGHAQLRVFKHGVYFVSMASIKSPEHIPAAIAGVLNFAFQPRKKIIHQLLNTLQSKQILLILDNFEHLVSGAPVLASILEECPEVAMLITSQERLYIRGETVCEISGMAYPSGTETVPHTEYSALSMFEYHAGLIETEFKLDDSNFGDVVRICRMVEGVPLAIELAASLVRVLSCREIADEIDKNLDSLQSMLRNVPDRHRSLRTVFDYSWNLLDEERQLIYAQLTAFQGGFDKDAAQVVANAGIRDLMVFADKSLLRKKDSNRFQMPHILKRFATEKREERSDLQNACLNRHCRYYADRISRITHIDKTVWIQEIRDELDNYRAGWDFSVRNCLIEEMQTYLPKITLVLENRGLFVDGEKSLSLASDRLSQAACEQDDKSLLQLRGRLLCSRGWFCYRLGRSQEARSLLRECEKIFQETGNPLDLAAVYNNLGLTEKGFGNYREARTFHEKSLAICEENGSEPGMARSYNNLGDAYFMVGDYQQARQWFQKSIAIRKRRGIKKGMASSLHNLGNVEKALGNFHLALELYTDSLTIKRKLGDRRAIASSLNNLGITHDFLGDYDEAEKMFRESLIIKKEIGDLTGIANSLHNLGCLAILKDAYSDSESLFRESLEIRRRGNDQAGVANSLSNLGIVAGKQGDYQRAHHQITESLEIYRRIGNPWGIAFTLKALGDVFTRQNAFSKAFQNYFKSIHTALEIGGLPLVLDVILAIASALIKQELFHEDALAYASFVLGHDASYRKTHKLAMELKQELTPRIASDISIECIKRYQTDDIPAVVKSMETADWNPERD